mgnify:CR=1 FL=1
MTDLNNCFGNVNNILANAPPSTFDVKQRTIHKVKRMCLSELGIGCIGALCCFVLLLLLRPPYICNDQTNNAFDRNNINYSKLSTIVSFIFITISAVPTIIQRIR